MSNDSRKKPKPGLAVRISTTGEELWSTLDGGISRLELGEGNAPRKKYWQFQRGMKSCQYFSGNCGASALMGMNPYGRF